KLVALDTSSQNPPAAAPKSTAPSFAQSLFGGADFLPPDQAFSVSVQMADADTVLAQFKPADTYYLYRDKLGFKLGDAPGVEIAQVEIPPGEAKEDPNFGRTQVFHKPFQAVLKLRRAPSAAEKASLAVSYQGCS